MKKTRLWGLASILAAGALVFGAAGCDSGNDEYTEETPAYYAKVNDASGNDTSVTAVWDFTTNYASFSTDTKASLSSTTALKASSGTGATLLPTYIKGGYSEDYTGFQVQAGSVSLSALAKSYYFTLTLAGQSNIQIYAKSPSDSASKRLVSVYDSNGVVVAQKDCIEKNNNEGYRVVGIEGAAAGDYTVYANGVIITMIDCNASSTVEEVKGVKAVSFTNTSVFSTSDEYKTTHNVNGYYITKDLLDSVALAVTGYSDSEAKTSIGDVTSSATFYVISGDSTAVIATAEDGSKSAVPVYAGTAVVRARVGMYMTDFALVATGSADFSLSSSATSITDIAESAKTFKAGTGSLPAYAVKKDTLEDISSSVTWTSSDEKVATVSAGVVSGVAAGTATITAKFTDGAGNEYSDSVDVTVEANDSIIVTLLDTSSDKFPEQDTSIALYQTTFDELTETTTTVVNAGTSGVTYKNFSVTAPVIDSTWSIASVVSNKTDTDYPGILATQGTTGTFKSNTDPVLKLAVVITPPTGKTLQLNSVAGVFRSNKYKNTVEVLDSDSNVLAASSESKDQRKFSTDLSSPLTISAKTTIMFTLTNTGSDGKKVSSGDKVSFGNLKLYLTDVTE